MLGALKRPAALVGALALVALAALVGAEMRLRARPDWYRLDLDEDPPWVSFLGVKHLFGRPTSAGPRWLCIGGSTTVGYPFPHAGYPEWLQLELSRCGGQASVLNRGVGSYGTLREPIVLEQELPATRPSIVVFNSGQNEVQERMLYDAIPAVLRGPVGAVLAGTALGTALVRALPKLRYRGAWQGPWGLPSALKRPRQEAVEEAFERSLRAMVRRARDAGALPVVCVTPVNLLYPLGDSEGSAFGALPFEPQRWEWYDTFVRARALWMRGRSAQALRLLDSLPPEAGNAHLDWLRGACAHNLGQWARARVLLRKTANSFLASDRMRRAQRRIAAEEGAVLVDLEAAFAAGIPDGTPDPRYFSDAHHLSEIGYRTQAREILRALARRGQAPAACPAPWSGRDEGMAARELKVGDLFRSTAAALQANAVILFYMGSDNPWFIDRAQQLLASALRADPKLRFAKHLHADLPLVAGAMAQALRTAGRADEALAWERRAAEAKSRE